MATRALLPVGVPRRDGPAQARLEIDVRLRRVRRCRSSRSCAGLVAEPPLNERDDDALYADDRVRWRAETDGNPAAHTMVASPYDLDVHNAKKRIT